MLRRIALVIVCLGGAWTSRAWDAEGHRIVNQLALASLPADFPDFVRAPANAERVLFLANVPDRWRNVDPWLRQSGGSWSDHFIDLEHLTAAGIDPRTVPSLRYDFIVQYAAARMIHADKFEPIDPTKNTDHTAQWPGFAPWAMTEYFHRLRSAFGYLKAYQEVGGTAAEIANAQADVLFMMGVMGHYIGDCAQPLHTTANYNGWTSANPNGYTTWRGLHSWVDGGFVAKAGIKAYDLQPRVLPVEPVVLAPRSDGRDAFFVAAMEYILTQHEQVEPIYQLEKAGKLGHTDQPITPEARALIEGQLLRGAQMLAKTWVTAWQSAPVDAYLRTQLGKRQAGAAAASGSPVLAPIPTAAPATAP